MIQTAMGNGSAKATRRHTWKRHLRIEAIARLCAQTINGAHLSREEIAVSVGLSAATIDQIKKTPEFHAKMVEVTTGQISYLDKDLREIRENKIAELEAMVPSALLALRSSLLSRNENIRLKAAIEIMDRDGELGKVSRVNITHEIKPDLAAINKTADDIMALLGRPGVSATGPINTIEDANVIGTKVSSIMSSFSVSAIDATEQVKDMDSIIDAATLADFDVLNKKIQ